MSNIQMYNEYSKDNLVSLSGIMYSVHFINNSEFQFIPKTSEELDKVYGDLNKSVKDIEKLLRGKTGMIWRFDANHDASGLVFKNDNYASDMVTMVVY